jgi:thiol:disulfide interchange protein
MQRTRIAALVALIFALGLSAPMARPQMSSYYFAEVHKVIYPPPAVAPGEIQHAIADATREHKRVIVDFGGNWCSDCKVLDYYLHEPPNAGLLARDFILVDINIGLYTHNLDLAEKYNIPIRKGVPALAVLSSRGRLLYSQTGGQFENMSRISLDAVTAFLDMWKPVR